MSTSHETILFVDLKALEHNYFYLKSKLNADTEIIAVIKAFAYGHGDIVVAKKLETLGVHAFGSQILKRELLLENQELICQL